MHTALYRTVFRHLIRSAREFDRNPVLKALLTKHDFPSDLDALVNTFLGGQNFYVPSPLMPRSVADFAKQSFRYPPSTESTIDTALASLRYLSALLRLADKHRVYSGKDGEQAARSKRQEGANYGKEMGGVELLSNTPEPGALLIAHPMQQGFFQRAVVLLTSTQPMQGSAGLCMNKPSDNSNQVRDYSLTGGTQGHSVGGTDYLQGDFSRHVPGFGIVKVEHLETSETDEGQTFRLAFSIGDTDSEEEEDQVDVGAASSEWQHFTGEGSPVTSAAESASRDSEAGVAGTSSSAEQGGRAQSHDDMLFGSQQLRTHFSHNDVCCGGPVATHSLQVLHTRADLGGSQILHGASEEPGLRFGFSTEQLQEQVSIGNVAAREMRFFDGECLWAPLQLEMELAGGAWLCVRANQEDLKRLLEDEIPNLMRSQPERRGQTLWDLLLQSIHELSGEYSQLSSIPVNLAVDVAMLEIT